MPRRLCFAVALSTAAAWTCAWAGAMPGSELPGFASDDLAAALRTFRASCAASARAVAPLRPAASPPPAMSRVCAKAARLDPAEASAAAFFAGSFEPRRVAGVAFFTGYYEPVVAGSLAPTARLSTPLYAPPAGLVAVKPGATPGLDPALSAARRLPDGRLVALPDRAAIETGALGGAGRPIVYVESPLEAFFIQVQGSARIRLPDGTLKRLVYAGRNGYPYTSIGKVLRLRLAVPPEAMGMAQLKAWIEANGQGADDAGTKLMRQNRSYIFFRFDDALPGEAGPIGGEGISLTPGRSLAIDRTIYPYGLPFYVDATMPDGTPFRRLLIGQDTGAAIVGPTRADVFFGTGDAAAIAAGAMRQTGTLTVLWPKADGAAGR